MEQETKYLLCGLAILLLLLLWNITPRYKLEKHMTVISNGIITPESTWASKGEYCQKITPYLITTLDDKNAEFAYNNFVFKKAPNDTVVCYREEWIKTKDWGFIK